MPNDPPIFGEVEMISAVCARRWIHESALMVRLLMLNVKFFTDFCVTVVVLTCKTRYEMCNYNHIT